MSIETLLDSLQLSEIKSETEVDLAFNELFNFGSFEDKHKLTLIYNAIKKKIRTRPQNKEVFIVTIKTNCKKCENLVLKNGLKLSSGKIDYLCNRCKGLSPKKDTCKKCNATGKVAIVCPACKGKTYVILKRRVQKGEI